MMLFALAMQSAPLLAASDAQLQPEVRTALDQASALRVELAADLLFGLIDSGKVPKDTSLEYLERLFYRASEAQRSFPMISVPRSTADTKGGDFPLFLSQLSVTSHDIRVRSILRMAALDKKRARQLLAELYIDTPAVKMDCGQIAIPSYSPNFYSRLLRTFPDDFGEIVQHVSTPQQAAVLIVSILNLGSVSSADMTSATSSIAGAFETANVSYRTFSATELNLGLGALLEKLVSSGSVPPGMEGRLVKAYFDYVGRHLGGERCSDGPKRDNEDTVVKTAVGLANRMAEKYQLPRLDASRLETRFSALLPEAQEESGPMSESPALFSILMKFVKNGAPEVAAEFAGELQKYTASGLRPGASAFDIAARAGVLMMIVTKFEDDYVAELAVKELFRVLEHPRLMEIDATAWMVVARTVLNTSRHPRAALAKLVDNRIAVSNDPTLISYFAVVRFTGEGHDYMKDPFASPGELMTKY
ncbi:MAG: hypothetical protein IH602_01665 [Bryobacteraceae bacterium]|nr:hypothetical protein [Bryobacteraceae bacterium]